MTNHAIDDERWLEVLSALPMPRADEARAERTRERCRAVLGRRRARVGRWPAGALTWMPRLEAAGITLLAVYYLGGAIDRALTLLGR